MYSLFKYVRMEYHRILLCVYRVIYVKQFEVSLTF